MPHLYNVSDDDIDYQIRDRLSFCRFLGRDLEDKIPDAETIWLFQEQLTRHERHKTLFEHFDQQCEFELNMSLVLWQMSKAACIFE